MSTTDELRAELTKRGIEWRWEDERTTYWCVTVDGEEWGEWTAIEMGGYLHLSFSSGDVLTPAQAIAATLDAGTCEADETDLIPFVRADSGDFDVDYIHVMECSVCGGTYEHVNGGYEFCPRCGKVVVGE